MITTCLARAVKLGLAVYLVSTLVQAQETRSMLFGRVLDPQGAAVVNATVTIRNVNTGVTLPYKTNATGY